MTAEPIQKEPAAESAVALLADPPAIQRTAEEKARILARLTLQLAALENDGGRSDGDA
jgi:hypothetical protein